MKRLPYGIKFNLVLCALIGLCLAYAIVVALIFTIGNALE